MGIKKGAVTLPEWWLEDTPSEKVIAITDGEATCCCEPAVSMFVTVVMKDSLEAFYDGYFHVKDLSQDETVKYENIAFLQDDDANMALKLYNERGGLETVFDYLLEHKPDEPDVSDDYPGGEENFFHVIKDYIIGVNTRLNTISLTRVVSS